MKPFLLSLFVVLTAITGKAQTVDSICFHLYTDSLKKGTYNYINVDGKLSNDRWLPLTAKEISFSASAGRFDGNSLYIEPGFTAEKITVKAILKANPALFKETILFIKKLADPERLATMEGLIPPGNEK